MYNHKEVREIFLEFYKNLGYKIYPSFNLSINDDSLFFVNSGMAPMKKYFTHEEECPEDRIATSQVCLRIHGKHNDMNEIGQSNTHHTLFEMLGNFCFRHVEKQNIFFEAINFLKSININIDKVHFTYHPNDIDTYNIITNIYQNIPIYPDISNTWCLGDFGPYGYNFEIYYDNIEIWNIVFVDKYKLDDSSIKDLSLMVDTGMGLERLVRVLSNCDSTYKTSVFKDMIDVLSSNLNLSYNTIADNSDYKIILDHSRAIVAVINSNIYPTSNGIGYIVRKLIRRICRFIIKNNINNNIVKKLFDSIDDYIGKNKLTVFKYYLQEYDMVIKSIQTLHKLVNTGDCLTGEKLFYLHDTLGIHIDTILLDSKERSYVIDIDSFYKIVDDKKYRI